MAYDEDLAQRIRMALGGYVGLTERKMFGGLCFMLYGNMCCGVVKDTLMVRVGPAEHDDALAQPGARPMDFTGRPMKGMVYVDAEACASDNDLAQWVERGLAFVMSLPAK